MIDWAILDGIQNLRTPFLDALMPIITNSVSLWFVLTAVLLLIPKTRKIGIILSVAILLEHLIVSLGMKPLFQRERPFEIRDIELLISAPRGYSFPSGHSALSFAAASVIWLRGPKKWRLLAVIAACAIAFSRLYLYVHFPSDVLVGAAVGIFCGWAAVRLTSARDKKTC